MNEYFVRVQLESDTTFGRGDGVAGWVDAEVEHDQYGLPFLRGRALKGLLAEECANVLFALQNQQPPLPEKSSNEWRDAADYLFGKGGSRIEDEARLCFDDALLPDDLREAVAHIVELDKPGRLDRHDILTSLTATRRQTAMNIDGAPLRDSLRSMRVVLRETVFDANLYFDSTPKENEKQIILLGACVAALRRIGLGRNRGRGRVKVSLCKGDRNAPQDITMTCLQNLQKALASGA